MSDSRMQFEALANNQRTICSVVDHMLDRIHSPATMQVAACKQKLRQVERALEKYFPEKPR